MGRKFTLLHSSHLWSPQRREEGLWEDFKPIASCLSLPAGGRSKSYFLFLTNIKHQTSNIKHQTSNIKQQTSNRNTHTIGRSIFVRIEIEIDSAQINAKAPHLIH